MNNTQGFGLLTAEEQHILLHSLGLNHAAWSYRNRFVTGEGSVDYPHCMSLVGKGMMTRREGGPLSGGDYVFLVTEEGKGAALRSRAAMGGEG